VYFTACRCRLQAQLQLKKMSRRNPLHSGTVVLFRAAHVVLEISGEINLQCRTHSTACSAQLMSCWLMCRRLKVHYRAPPSARGSGVERGHGQELPFCPLCNLDLRDVKYHKCAAGPAGGVRERQPTQGLYGHADQPGSVRMYNLVDVWRMLQPTGCIARTSSPYYRPA